MTSGTNYANDNGDLGIVEGGRSKMTLDIFADIICDSPYYHATLPPEAL